MPLRRAGRCSRHQVLQHQRIAEHCKGLAAAVAAGLIPRMLVSLCRRRDAMDLTQIDSENGPFGDAFDCRFVYLDGLRRRIQKDILSGIGRTNGLIFLSGEPGAGKTTMLRCLAEEIRTRADCHLLGAAPFLTCRQDMALRDLADEFSYTRYLARFSGGGSEQPVAAGVGGRAVILLDDAQRLSPKVVVQLRRWRRAFQSVRGRLSIILAICEEDNAATVAAIREDAGSSGQDLWKRLRPFNRNDVQRLIHHRLDTAGFPGATTFPPEAVMRVFAHTHGNPARTICLCRRVLALMPPGSERISGALVDMAAEAESIPSFSTTGEVILRPASGITLGSLPELSSVPDPGDETAARTESPGREIGLGRHARLLGLAAVATTALAIGWFYGARHDDPATPAAAPHPAASEGSPAALALVQPSRERKDSPATAADHDEASSPAPDERVLLAQDQTPRGAPTDAVVLDESDAGNQQPLENPDPETSDPEPQEPAAEIAPPEPEPTPVAAEPEPQEPAIEAAPPEPLAADPEPQPQEPAADATPPEPEPMPEPAPAAADPEPQEPATEIAPPAPTSDPLAPASVAPEVSEGREPPAAEKMPSPPPPGPVGPGVDDLIARGNRLLELGDVAAARLFFTMAAERGSADGAMFMGLTFDPVYFEGKSIFGTRPDVYEAMDWYARSASMGGGEAEKRISALELWLRQAAQEGDEDARHALRLLDRQ